MNNGGSVGILQGNGDGTFQRKVNFAAGLSPSFVAVGEFNSDGKPDLGVVNYDRKAPSKVSILMNATPR
jgi:hypothetical protein